MSELWQEEAKRLGGEALMGFLIDMRDQQQKTVEEMAKFNRAFPHGDADAHRRYHESVIEWRELRNRMVRTALEKMAGAGAMAAVAWLVYAIWTTLKMEVKR